LFIESFEFEILRFVLRDFGLIAFIVFNEKKDIFSRLLSK